LVLHTIQTGCASRLTKWAKTLALPSNKVSFFNFLASHDGIGLNPVRGILDETEIQQMVACTSGGGGLVSYKDNPDGSRSVYELNINYFDALNGQSIEDPINVQVARFMASQAIMLSLAGVPGIYFHSLFGSRGWLEGVHTTGRNRSINRQKLVRSDLERELNTKGSIRQLIFERYCLLLQTRQKCTAFHPAAKQELLELDPGVFSLARSSLDGNQIILALQNVTGRLIELRIKESLPWVSSCQDLFTGSQIAFTETITLLSLAPYQTAWLEIK
jgi:sucrose phosphorylase